MRFNFPQVKGLASSHQSTYYGIGSQAGALACLAHPLLGPRLIECTEALLRNDEASAVDILDDLRAARAGIGAYIDYYNTERQYSSFGNPRRAKPKESRADVAAETTTPVAGLNSDPVPLES